MINNVKSLNFSYKTKSSRTTFFIFYVSSVFFNQHIYLIFNMNILVKIVKIKSYILKIIYEVNIIYKLLRFSTRYIFNIYFYWLEGEVQNIHIITAFNIYYRIFHKKKILKSYSRLLWIPSSLEVFSLVVDTLSFKKNEKIYVLWH